MRTTVTLDDELLKEAMKYSGIKEKSRLMNEAMRRLVANELKDRVLALEGSSATKRFFATVQNKLHWAIHGQTAAEVIVSRADRQQGSHGAYHVEGRTYGKSPKVRCQRGEKLPHGKRDGATSTPRFRLPRCGRIHGAEA